MIKFYLFENGVDFLDFASKVSEIIIAFLALIFSIYIYIKTFASDKKKIKYDKKIDFFKTIILSNLNVFFNFYGQLFIILDDLSNRIITDDEKSSINELMQDELKQLRLNFYDLTITYDNQFYNFIKNESDTLIDKLTITLFENDDFSTDTLYSDKIESLILFSRQKILSKIFNEFN